MKREYYLLHPKTRTRTIRFNLISSLLDFRKDNPECKIWPIEVLKITEKSVIWG